jgi:hypothetical protein
VISRSTATLQLLIGLFSAGAITCGVGLVRTLAGYQVQAWELFLFLAVACGVTGYGWQQLVRAEYSRERVLQDREKLINQERAAALAARAVPVAVPVPVADDDLTPVQRGRQFEIAHWHTFYRRLAAAGFAYGWDIRTLTDPAELTRVTSQGGWNTGTGRLVSAGFLVKDNTGTRPTVSEAEWNAGRLWEQVTCPLGEPPDILPGPYTRQQTKHETPAKHAVLENAG